MTTEGECDNVDGAVRSMRKRNATSFNVLKSCDEENSDTSEDGSSEDEWRNTKKKTARRKHKSRPARTLKKSLAEKTKKLQLEFNKTVKSTLPDARSCEETNSDAPKPDTTTTESRKSSEVEERKPVVTFMCDIIDKVASTVKTTQVENSTNPSSSGTQNSDDNLMKCDSSIKSERIDTNVKIKQENIDAEVKNAVLKLVKSDKDSDADADTVILLSDDDDEAPGDSNTVVLNCNILQTSASPILTGKETTPSSPATPTIRVRPLEQISNAPSPVYDVTASPPVPPSIPYNPVSPVSQMPNTLFASPLGSHAHGTIPPAFSPLTSTPPRARGANRSRQSSQGRVRASNPTPRTRASPNVRGLTPRGGSRRRSSSNYSPRSRIATPPRLDSISLSDISPTGTVIRSGLNSITITPTKKSPERPVQRRLFKSEVEGIITARESGYVVSLANGSYFPLSHVQVEKLREQNNGALPTKLRIPVPSDVAASIETRIVIDD